jgi:glycosyltransferase involved in cell wall biosynthesis
MRFVCLGEAGDDEQHGNATIHFQPYERDSKRIALHYQAADVHLHAAKADTFPTTVLEAIACGTPVVATSVGGIPEQVIDGVTGYLVPSGGSAEMAARIMELQADPGRLRGMSERAASLGRERFGADRMVSDYLSFYGSVLS